MTVLERRLKPRMQAHFPVVTELVVEDRGNATLTVIPVMESRQFDPVYRVRLAVCPSGSNDAVAESLLEKAGALDGDIAAPGSTPAPCTGGRLQMEAYCGPPIPIDREADKVALAHAPRGGSATRWLENRLLPKLGAWSSQRQRQLQQLGPEDDVADTKGRRDGNGVADLLDKDMIPRSALSDKYYELKQRHGQRLVSMWPASTDPQKYVFEDIAIASFLLLLWDRVRAPRVWMPSATQPMVRWFDAASSA